MNVALYIAPTGAHISTESVTIRKAPTDPNKRKPFRFVPLAENGQDRVALQRYTLTRENTLAYIAATDAEARTAILADIEPLEIKSNVSPTFAQLTLMRELVDKSTLAAMLAAGILAVPSERAERAAKTASGNRALSEAERTAAALDALFAEAETEPTTEPASEPEPEPVKSKSK